MPWFLQYFRNPESGWCETPKMAQHFDSKEAAERIAVELAVCRSFEDLQVVSVQS